jgi:CarD family transcriptional regulator, regulator of rRNA transcription
LVNQHRPARPRGAGVLRGKKALADANMSEKDRARMSTKKSTAKSAAPAKAAKAPSKAQGKGGVRHNPKVESKTGHKVEAKKPELRTVAKADVKVVHKTEVKPGHQPKVVAGTNVKAVPSAVAAVKAVPKPEKKKPEFRTNDWVVYPAHGVGRIVSVVEQEVAGIKLELFVINFDKDKMTLRVPVAKASSVGMRRLSSPDVVATALQTLRGRARIKRTMWSRRAQEYEAKINSGDLISIAEVVRDLHRASGQPEQSYSERQLYEAALGRMAREVAAVERIDEDAAVKRLETALQRAA